MSARLTESVIEAAALAWLESLGYAVLHGIEIAASMPGAERSDPNYRDVILEGRLRQALARLYPTLPARTIDDPYQVTLTALPDTLLPKLLSGGIRVKMSGD